MSDVISRLNQQRLWQFPGGIHPPEMKTQSNRTPIQRLPLAPFYFVPLVQHAGKAGELCVKEGDVVLKGQPLTRGDTLRELPVHAPTSGRVVAITPYVSSHPSGIAETTIVIQADGDDRWIARQPRTLDTLTPEQLLQLIYEAGIAGLGGGVFPSAAKAQSAQQKCRALIINGAECEPYITCDDRLMQDESAALLEGIEILQKLLSPEQVIIAIEDNKPEAIAAMKQALAQQCHEAVSLRVIPTKYPSGASDQLIQVLTGLEVPNGGRASDLGVTMFNVGTVYAIKRAVLDDEPMIERAVTLTGNRIQAKGNYWLPLGTPIEFALAHAGYQAQAEMPIFLGGPMMGFTLPSLKSPVTKTTNCLIAPDHTEYSAPEPERNCIRCSACSDACPVQLLPMQMYWFSRAHDHEKAEEYNLFDCIECGVCSYVCPSYIPLVQYFRQEKAEIREIQRKAEEAELAKQRFEAREARLAKEKEARMARIQQATEQRRSEIAQSTGEDPVAAALARLKAKQAAQAADTPEQATKRNEKGQLEPDNHALMEARRARRLARQAEEKAAENSHEAVSATSIETKQDATENSAVDPKKAAIQAALARAKAKKAATQAPTDSAAQAQAENATENTEPLDPKKAAIQAALARAKAKKAAMQNDAAEKGNEAVLGSAENQAESQTENAEPLDPKKAAIQAALARAKAKKAAMQNDAAEKGNEAVLGSAENQAEAKTETATAPQTENAEPLDPKKAAIQAAIARAKAKKAAMQNDATEKGNEAVLGSAENKAEAEAEAEMKTEATPQTENSEPLDPKKAAIQAAIARAKAKKASMQGN